MKNLLSFVGVVCLSIVLQSTARGAAADTVYLTDRPGNWFRSQNTGTPVSVVKVGQSVDFTIDGCCTSTRHTVTLLVKPDGSTASSDQDDASLGTFNVTFDKPGVYIFGCKIHPYMNGVVAVKDGAGNVPDVTATSLPFIGHLGATSLPASTVLSVLATAAPTDADKRAKWDIKTIADQFLPSTPGVGEVWVDTQFERVPRQTDTSGVEKPGTITVVRADNFKVRRKINGRFAGGFWNNPHNMWATFDLSTIYNSNWFGKWINKIDRASGKILDSIEVGEAPTHIVTIPTPGSAQKGELTVMLSAQNLFVKVQDGPGGLQIVDNKPTSAIGFGHPHGQWLTCGQGDRMVVPNVFQGLGVAGSISILDTASGDILKEFAFAANDPLLSALLMPLAAGECHVHSTGAHKAYVGNVVSGFVTVIDVDAMQIIKNIPVTLTPDGQTGFNIFDTLQVPIQTPVSPDGRWVAVAVFSLTTVPRSNTGAANHVAIIDTATDQVVKFLPTSAGTHGCNWGAKKGGGYYAYVACQHANVMEVIDPDPNGDGNAGDAALVGRILLATGVRSAGSTDGTGGQGIKPLPMVHDGWIQPTVALSGTGALAPAVEQWIRQLTPAQKKPVQ